MTDFISFLQILGVGLGAVGLTAAVTWLGIRQADRAVADFFQDDDDAG
ncbi:hypothetical protein HHL26_04670 [Sphingobium sp. TB-6]|nr:hypothetical protein [Sphingobium sp. TB-6]NML88359.1 hypothetical protein [Sphingobium sp. TB-6]